jgi:hypothetical protein
MIYSGQFEGMNPLKVHGIQRGRGRTDQSKARARRLRSKSRAAARWRDRAWQLLGA